MDGAAHKLPPAPDAIGSLLWEGPEIVLVTRLSDGSLIAANDTAVELAGVPRERFLGRTSVEVGLWADPGERAAFLCSLFEHGRIDGMPVSVRTADGELLVSHVSARLASIDGEAVIVSVARDVTETLRTERLLAVEHAVMRVLREERCLTRAAPNVLAAIGERLGFEVGVWWWVDAPAGLLRQLASWRSALARSAVPPLPVDDFAGSPARAGPSPPSREAASVPWPAHSAGDGPPQLNVARPGTTFRIGHGLPGWVWELGRPTWVPEVHPDGHLDWEPADGLHSAALFPLSADGDVLGVVEFLSRAGRQADDAIVETFESLGGQLGQFARGRAVACEEAGQPAQ